MSRVTKEVQITEKTSVPFTVPPLCPPFSVPLSLFFFLSSLLSLSVCLSHSLPRSFLLLMYLIILSKDVNIHSVISKHLMIRLTAGSLVWPGFPPDVVKSTGYTTDTLGCHVTALFCSWETEEALSHTHTHIYTHTHTYTQMRFLASLRRPMCHTELCCGVGGDGWDAGAERRGLQLMQSLSLRECLR